MSCNSIVAMLALASALPMAAAQAQMPPTGGQLLREVQPPPRNPAPRTGDAAMPDQSAPRAPMAASEGMKVRLKAVRVTGARTQSPAQLQALVADAVGQELDFAGLQALADRIGTHYRGQGYAVARAYLPAQELRDGELEIAVQEGVLGKMNVSVAEGVPADEIQARMARLREGEPLMAAALEGDLLTLADVPGLRVRSVLRPGQSVGQSDLDIEVAPGDQVTGSASLDNHGNRFSGEYRATGRVAVAGALAFGDSVDAMVTYAGQGFGYVRAAWQMPLGASDWQAGVAQSAMSYELGKEFSALQARGRAFDSTLYAIGTLQRSRAARSQVNLSLDVKRFDDEANGLTSTKRVDVLALAADGRWELPSASVWGNAAVNVGRLDLDSANADADAIGHRTAGGYEKLSLQGEYEQALADGVSFALRVNAQMAGKNLDSSEKLDLGGLQGVRAYAQGEASSDDAVIVNAELSHELGGWKGKLLADYGRGRAWHRPIAGDGINLRIKRGLGVGLDYRMAGGFALQAVVARPTGRASNRLWMHLSKAF